MHSHQRLEPKVGNVLSNSGYVNLSYNLHTKKHPQINGRERVELLRTDPDQVYHYRRIKCITKSVHKVFFFKTIQYKWY